MLILIIGKKKHNLIKKANKKLFSFPRIEFGITGNFINYYENLRINVRRGIR